MLPGAPGGPASSVIAVGEAEHKELHSGLSRVLKEIRNFFPLSFYINGLYVLFVNLAGRSRYSRDFQRRVSRIGCSLRQRAYDAVTMPESSSGRSLPGTAAKTPSAYIGTYI